MITLRRLVAPALLALAIPLSGCAVADAFTPSTREDRFQDLPAFVDDYGSEFAPIDWVPSDSILLAAKMSTRTPSRMLRFVSEDGVRSEGCSLGRLVGKPSFETEWWPSGEPAEGLTCEGGWQVFGIAGTWYGWVN